MRLKPDQKPPLRKQRPEDYINGRGGDSHPALLKKYAVRITDTVKDTIKGDIHSDPVAKQYIPQMQELTIQPEEMRDPIGDDAHTPVKGIVHRYPDRVLFKPVNVCAVYCRYCFRREHVGPQHAAPLSEAELDAALSYIRNHKDIFEVILTGGDPLVISAKQLTTIMQRLDRIKHVKIIRFHTRVPIADPVRITEDIINALNATDKAVYIALHINHAQELNEDVRACLSRLHKAGINLLSQSVLLKGVNDDASILADLYRELLGLNVKPYYLHHPDLAPGTSHFRLPLKRGQEIVAQLRGHLSGLCQPTYMLDIPGGHGKVPCTPGTPEYAGNGEYEITDFNGNTHTYTSEADKAGK